MPSARKWQSLAASAVGYAALMSPLLQLRKMFTDQGSPLLTWGSQMRLALEPGTIRSDLHHAKCTLWLVTHLAPSRTATDNCFIPVAAHRLFRPLRHRMESEW